MSKEPQTTCPVCKSNNRKREQKLIDVMFEIAIRMQARGLKFKDREDCGAYIARQLRELGFDTKPVGCSWGILQ